MNQEEKIFAKGFSFKRHEKAPDFVVGSLSVKLDDAIEFMKSNQRNSGWVNLSIKRSKNGAYYVELDKFEPNKDKNNDNTKSSNPYSNSSLNSSSSSFNDNRMPNNFGNRSLDDDSGLPF